MEHYKPAQGMLSHLRSDPLDNPGIRWLISRVAKWRGEPDRVQPIVIRIEIEAVSSPYCFPLTLPSPPREAVFVLPPLTDGVRGG